MNSHLKRFIGPAAALAALCSHPVAAFADDNSIKIRIHYTAAAFATYIDSDPNGGVTKFGRSRMDVYWNANLDTSDGSMFLTDGPHVLPETTTGDISVTPISGTPCAGTLTYNSDPSFAPGLVLVNDKDGVDTIKSISPAFTGGSSDALIEDKSQTTGGIVNGMSVRPSQCRVPFGGAMISDSLQTLGHWSYVPTEFLLPEEINAGSPMLSDEAAESSRSYESVGQFNAKDLGAHPGTAAYSPFSYEYDNVLGTVTTKMVFFGRFEIDPNPTGTPGAIDGYALGGYVQPTAPQLPNNPPVNLLPAKPPTLGDFLTWLKTKVFPGVSRNAGALFAAMQKGGLTAVLTGNPKSAEFERDALVALLNSYSAAHSSISLPDLGTYPPGPCVVKIQITSTNTGGKLVSSTTTSNSEGIAKDSSVTVKLDSKTKTAIKGGKAFTAYVVLSVTPSGSKTSATYSSKFSVKTKPKK